MKALEVIYDALARYKQLCEGDLQGTMQWVRKSLYCWYSWLHLKSVQDQPHTGIEGSMHDFMCSTAGHCVSQVQRVHGIQFLYRPPPRTAVPQAAALLPPTQRYICCASEQSALPCCDVALDFHNIMCCCI